MTWCRRNAKRNLIKIDLTKLLSTYCLMLIVFISCNSENERHVKSNKMKESFNDKPKEESFVHSHAESGDIIEVKRFSWWRDAYGNICHVDTVKDGYIYFTCGDEYGGGCGLVIGHKESNKYIVINDSIWYYNQGSLDCVIYDDPIIPGDYVEIFDSIEKIWFVIKPEDLSRTKRIFKLDN